MGVRVEVEAGEIVSMEETGCPEGTTITVRDLFYNTPARQKFLSTDRSESAACVQSALRTALGRPDVSFRCLRDGQEEFFSPGDGTAKSAVYALLGRDAAAGLLPVETESDGVTVKGFVSAPGYCRGNRGAQYFFCNGRPIRSRALQAALEQAYKNTAMVGKFPGCVLYITLPNGLVDVNVHPTKAEVKFAKEKPVFDGVYYGTLAALGQKSAPQTMSNAPFASESEERCARFFPGPSRSGRRERAAQGLLPHDGRGHVPADILRRARPSGGYFRRARQRALPRRFPRRAETGLFRAGLRTGAHLYAGHSVRERAAFPRPRAGSAGLPGRSRRAGRKEPSRPGNGGGDRAGADGAGRGLPRRARALHRRGAERFHILLEQGDKMLLIDKHAAHERILFDKMRLNEKPLMPQELLEPQPFNTDPDGAALLEANAALLARLGFELDAFGDTAFLIRAVPAQLDAASAVPLLEELLEKLREGRSLSSSDVWERLAATVACKAAIKGGWVTEREELLALAEKVLAGEVTHCPHGRPVMTVFTRAELDKRFGRIV